LAFQLRNNTHLPKSCDLNSFLGFFQKYCIYFTYGNKNKRSCCHISWNKEQSSCSLRNIERNISLSTYREEVSWVGRFQPLMENKWDECKIFLFFRYSGCSIFLISSLEIKWHGIGFFLKLQGYCAIIVVININAILSIILFNYRITIFNRISMRNWKIFSFTQKITQHKLACCTV